MKKPTLLVVDDEKNTRDGLARALRQGYTVKVAEDGPKALEVLAERPVDAVITDVRMPGMDGLTLLQRILARSPQPIFILLTAYGSIDMAVEAMKRGAHDFLTKPVNLDHLDLLLKRALRSREIEPENKALRERLDTKFGLENIIGSSDSMQEVFNTVKQMAPSRATVLIQGESGTGKELVAQAVHRLSPRHKAPFVAVHCAALSETLLESELFGHEKGAFTGAMELRRGRFELADGGTLFLDEIGEITPSIQVKILRVLEERRFERVGGQKTLDVDVRLIAATNRDLKAMVDKKEFRDDLFYRLNVITVNLPPLHQRREDIPLLIQHFIKIFATENQKEIEGLTPDVLELLVAYDWPGNVRELRNVLERMIVLSPSQKLTVRDVPASIKEHVGHNGTTRTGSDMSLEVSEKELIVKALKACNGNRTKAAEKLGISRRTLHRKLNEYGISGRTDATQTI